MRRAVKASGSTGLRRQQGSGLLTSIAASIAAAFIVTGCASTQVETTGTPLTQPLCQGSRSPVTGHHARLLGHGMAGPS